MAGTYEKVEHEMKHGWNSGGDRSLFGRCALFELSTAAAVALSTMLYWMVSFEYRSNPAGYYLLELRR